jgi:hypothetical protein
MLQLKVEDKVFLKQLNDKIDAMKELASPTVMQEIAKAAFVITGEKFMNAVDREAVKNPKAFHHVYEWGRLGSPDGRLFVLERRGILGGNLDIETSFLQSKVPVQSSLRGSGRGQRNANSSNIFRYKAAVMESGQPVSFTTSQVTPIGGEGFVAAGTRINILNPGGIQTKNSFGKFMVSWYVENLNSIMETSGLYERIEREVALALNKKSVSKSEIKSIVASIANSVTGGRDTIK